MNRLLAYLVLTCLGSVAAPTRLAAQNDGRYSEIFRWINVGFGGDTIRLGQPFHHAARYATPLTDTSYRLRSGTFGGADSIYIDVTKAGLVKAMRFVYAADAEYSRLAASYGKSLQGTGIRFHITKGSRFSMTWEDAATQFVLTSPESDGRVRAALTDRRLAEEPHN